MKQHRHCKHHPTANGRSLETKWLWRNIHSLSLSLNTQADYKLHDAVQGQTTPFNIPWSAPKQLSIPFAGPIRENALIHVHGVEVSGNLMGPRICNITKARKPSSHSHPMSNYYSNLFLSLVVEIYSRFSRNCWREKENNHQSVN